MKKLLFCFAVSMLALTGCKIDSDPMVIQDFIYFNGSSSEITIHSFAPDRFNSGVMTDHPFTIPVKGTHTLSFRGLENGDGNALNWNSPSRANYTTFSNGQKIVAQTYGIGGSADNLYRNRNYIKIDKLKLLYVFTDDFFDGGVPGE